MTAPIVPSSNVNVLGPDGKGISTAYQRFFNSLPGVGKPAAIVPIAMTGSPFQYLASEPGFLSISGGTVSATVLTRNGTAINPGNPAPVSNGDVVTITYTVAPTVNFIPS